VCNFKKQKKVLFYTYGTRFSVPYSFVSALKLFDPSLKIRGPAEVKQAKFIRERKVRTIFF